MTVSKLREILQLLEDGGYGNEGIAAAHDEIFIPGPARNCCDDDNDCTCTYDNEELADKLKELNLVDTDDGTWSIYV